MPDYNPESRNSLSLDLSFDTAHGKNKAADAFAAIICQRFKHLTLGATIQ